MGQGPPRIRGKPVYQRAGLCPEVSKGVCLLMVRLDSHGAGTLGKQARVPTPAHRSSCAPIATCATPSRPETERKTPQSGEQWPYPAPHCSGTPVALGFKSPAQIPDPRPRQMGCQVPATRAPEARRTTSPWALSALRQAGTIPCTFQI